MFYLIILIEDSFIQGEQHVAETIISHYQETIQTNKQKFESDLRLSVNIGSRNTQAVFTINKNAARFTRFQNEDIKQEIQQSISKIDSFFQVNKLKAYYFGTHQEYVIIKHNDHFYTFLVPDNLVQSFKNLNINASRLNNLTVQQKNIRPISMAALIILSVPVLIAVFFISFFVARSITSNIERIANATKTIANGNLDYRVEISSGDEIQDLGDNLNLMAHRLKLATDQIKRMERLEAWQEMARRLAHEIKNPLTPIKLSAERLQYAFEYKKDNFDEILEKTTNIVISETGRLENLVNEFSKFARLPYLNKSNKNIIETLQDILTFFEGAYPDFQIVGQFDPDVVLLEYDEDQIKQVVINIITNAIEACDGCEKHVTIMTSAVNRFILAIADNSGGIPEEKQEKVFEPYFTTKSGGTGLGLAIAERIIVEHGGNIWFQVEDTGTIFYIELPLVEEDT
jgi:nitrogen fixation/metabolism regulation signal transduction histidine kinase